MQTELAMCPTPSLDNVWIVQEKERLLSFLIRVVEHWIGGSGTHAHLHGVTHSGHWEDARGFTLSLAQNRRLLLWLHSRITQAWVTFECWKHQESCNFLKRGRTLEWDWSQSVQSSWRRQCKIYACTARLSLWLIMTQRTVCLASKKSNIQLVSLALVAAPLLSFSFSLS